MRAMLIASLFALAVGLLTGRSLAEDAKPEKPKATPKLVPVQLVLFTRSDKAVDLTRQDKKELGKKHLAHLANQSTSGALLANGPFGEKDDSVWRELCVYQAKTNEDARKLAAGSPAVKGGLYEVKTATWYVAEGRVTFAGAKTK